MSTPPSKICQSCGRAIEWRKKWSRDWENVKYCSASCRARKVSTIDQKLEQTILELLSQRVANATICPSEAARLVDPADWNVLMEPARRAARRLVSAGKVVITQGGNVVDPSTARGPIRIRLARRGDHLRRS
jgi:hypothetical protein